MDTKFSKISDINSHKKIDITPDISMMPKTGKTGYSLTQSLAELVDNSIDARINKITKIKVVLQSDFVIIEDDASGMNGKALEKALTLGYSKKKNQLGEFGIGLKAACTSLGSVFTITTSTKEERKVYLYKYDEEYWLLRDNKKDWKDIIQVSNKKDSNDYGTFIKIESLKRKIIHARERDVLKDFGNRFAPFISSGEIRIFVNRKECSPQNPELSKEGKKHFEIKLPGKNTIHGWYGLLKHGSNRGYYGFNTFRRGRMITSYDKIAIPSHPTVSRIIGEIHLDHVPVSHNKKDWEIESDEYNEALDFLKKEFEDLVKKARKTSLDEKITKDVVDKRDQWKKAIVNSVRTEIEDIFEKNSERRKRSKDSDDPVGEVLIEKRDPLLEKISKEIKARNERNRNPKKKQTTISHFITIHGKNYEIKHEFANLGKENSWKDYHYKVGEAIEVFTNKDFPAYAATRDVPFYAAIHIAEAIGEIIAQVNKESIDRANEYKEKILRRAAEIVEEF